MRSSLRMPTLLAITMQLLLGCSSAEKCDLPEQWESILNLRPLHTPIVVHVDLTAGTQIKWNGVNISRDKFFEYLRVSARQAPVPFLAIRARPQDCGVIEVLNQVAETYPCRQGACSLEFRQSGNTIPNSS